MYQRAGTAVSNANPPPFVNMGTAVGAGGQIPTLPPSFANLGTAVQKEPPNRNPLTPQLSNIQKNTSECTLI
jgi:hypothetical protein